MHSRLTPDARAAVANMSTEDARYGLQAAYADAQRVVTPALRMQALAGKIGGDEAKSLEADLVNRALDAAGITDYVSSRAPEVLAEPVRRSIISRAAKAASDTARHELDLEPGDINERLDRSAIVVRPDEGLASLSGVAGKGGSERSNGQASQEERGRRIGAPETGAQAMVGRGLAEEAPAAIEGFQPTLGQSTGDLGVLSLERELRARYRDLFIAHDAANNAALSHAVGDLAPEDAAATAGNWVRANLAAEDAAEEAEQSQLSSTARTGTQQLGGDPTTNSQADLGASARERLEQVRLPLKTAASQALDAVDPDGSLALPANDVAATARGLLGNPQGTSSNFSINPRAGETTASPEKPVLEAAANINGVVPFSDLRGLLGQTSAAQRAIRADPALGAESRPYARMRVLRQSIEDAMATGAEKTAEINARKPEQADIEQWGSNLAAGRDQWYGTRNSAETSRYGTNPIGDAGTRPTAVPGSSGATGEAGGRPGVPARVSPVSPAAQPVEPNFDAEAADRLKTANSAYADYKQRFRQGSVGDVLASGNSPSGYRLGDAQVVSRLFRPGAAGADSIDSLIRAAGSPEAAEQVLGDYPSYSLRLAAEKNGVIDPAAYKRWTSQYMPVLDQLPNLKERFSTVAQASQELADSAARWQQAKTDFQDTALRHYANIDPDTPPQAAIDRLMRTQDPVAESNDLMRRLRPNPDAVQSAQRNTVDWVLDKIRTTSEAGTTGERELSKAALQRLLEKSPAQAQALKTILGPQRFQVLESVSDAMDMAARAQQATQIKGSPGTAADLHALESHGQPSMLFQAWIGEKLGDAVGHAVGAVGGPVGAALRAAGAVGGVMLRNMRSAGLERVDQLAAQGVLNPELGRVLLGRAAQSAKDPRLPLIARQLGALGVSGLTQDTGERGHYAHGGAVIASARHLHHESKNADPEPSEAQKKAGNYRKAHIMMFGLPITIENAKGSLRRGVGKNGKPWAVRMPVAYGYFKRTTGMDGEHLDAYIGPDVHSPHVFVIDQVDAQSGEPDEHKALIGFKDLPNALSAYEKAFSDGKGYHRIGGISAMTIDQFKHWLEEGDTQKPLIAA